MSVEYVCDGCGKREKGWRAVSGEPIKPHDWFVRTGKHGFFFHACSRRCIEEISRREGIDKTVLPI